MEDIRGHVDEPMSVEQANLASALQRAFEEAGNPSLVEVAASGVGISWQRMSDWCAGRRVPSRFRDLEPVIAYLQVASASNRAGREAGVEVVTSFSTSRWRRIWREAVEACQHQSGT